MNSNRYLSARTAWLSLVALLGSLALAPLAQAQKDPGPWNAYESGSYIQFQKKNSDNKERYNIWRSADKTTGGATYDWNSSTKIETFRVTSSTSYNRVEYRGKTYNDGSGVYQFEGELRIPSSSNTNDLWVAQFWHAGLIKFNNGDLYYHPASLPDKPESGYNRSDVGDTAKIADNIKGTWVKINIIHDVKNRRVKIFVNDDIKINRQSVKTGTNDEYYFKYGVYDTSGSDAEVVEWKNTKIWKRG
jgi:hypothetical protein